ACPPGPRDISRPGVHARLDPPGHADPLGSALLELINDDVLRRRMGRAALSSSARFDPGEIAARYEDLFDDLVRGHRGAGGVLRSLGRETRGRLLSGAYTVTDTARRVKRSIA
ncbi:glycosyltransferase family 4 protein, partial [Streptomyces sp. NPDC059506]